MSFFGIAKIQQILIPANFFNFFYTFFSLSAIIHIYAGFPMLLVFISCRWSCVPLVCGPVVVVCPDDYFQQSYARAYIRARAYARGFLDHNF